MTNFSSSGLAVSMRRCRSGWAAQIARKSLMNFSNTGRRVLDILTPHLFVQRLAFDGAAAQQAPLFLRKVSARVDRAAVVPHQEIAKLPDVLEDELAPLADVIELVEDGIAFRLIEIFEPRGHQAVDKQRLSPGVGVADEDGMRVVGDAADVAGRTRLLGAIVFVDVECLSALELFLERRRHGLI